MSFDFKKYLKKQLPKEWKIVETLDINWDGRETLLVITILDGATDYIGVKTQPFQIMIYTLDLKGVKDVIDEFQRNHNQEYIRQDLQDIIQTYNPCVAIPQITTNGEDYYYQIYLTGVLQISDNIFDIKKVKIDGNEVNTYIRNISYNTIIDTQNKNINTEEVKTIIRNSKVSIIFTLIPRESELFEKLKSIRVKEISCNENFTIELIHNNDTIEEYTMKLTNQSFTSQNGSLVTCELNFTE